MAQGIFAVTEQRDGELRKVSFEVVSEGRRLADGLGTDLTAVVLGTGVEGLAEKLIGPRCALRQVVGDQHQDLAVDLGVDQLPHHAAAGVEGQGSGCVRVDQHGLVVDGPLVNDRLPHTAGTQCRNSIPQMGEIQVTKALQI